jgi:AraC-like DNA-binding protein
MPAAGVIINIVRAYLGPTWRPERIEFDLPRARSMTRVEDSFDCEVRSGATHVSVYMRLDAIATPLARGLSSPLVTLADVRRSRAGGSPVGLPDVVRELVRVQRWESSVSLDSIAEHLMLGPRTLQRQLESHSAGFRAIVNQVRLDHARALLEEEDLSITRIAGELGYSAPTHFARAFHRQMGLSPRRYRKVIAESEE